MNCKHRRGAYCTCARKRGHKGKCRCKGYWCGRRWQHRAKSEAQ